MVPAQHPNSYLASQTSKWNTTDHIDNYLYHLANPKTKSILAHNGWIDHEITYTYNSHGFRCEEFDPATQAVMTLGCSFTEGVGLPQEQTWPYLLAQQLNLCCWNLGVGSGSADMCFRLAEHYVTWLRPQLVVLLCPTVARIEFFNGICYTNVQVHQLDTLEYRLYRPWLVYDQNTQLNGKKNILAIESLCQKSNIDFYYCQQSDWQLENPDTQGVDWARDLAHRGVQGHKFFVQKILRSITRRESHIA